LRVCCTPQPAEGSPRFVHAGRGSPEGGRGAGDSPRGAFRTLRRVSLASSRKRIAACRCLPVVPSCPVGCRPKPVATDRIPADAGGVTPGVQPGDGDGRGSEELRGPGPRDESREAPKSRGGSVATAPKSRGGHGRVTAPKSRGRPGPSRGQAPFRRAAVPASVGRGVPAVPEGGEPGLRRAGIPSPGGSGRAGLRRAPSPGPGDGRGGSEEPGRPSGRAAAPKSRGGRGPDGVGPPVRRSVGPPRWRGSAPSGRVVPAEPGQGTGAPKSHGGDARNDRGPSPKTGHGVQGGDPDAVMLRSAEADPHITEHARGRGRGSRREGVRIARPRRSRSAGEAGGQSSHHPELAARGGRDGDTASGPPEGGPGVAPRPRPRTLRAQRRSPPRWGGGGARRNLAKQPTSRLCSADESVASSRRCQRRGARFFHGLRGPLQGRVQPAPSRRCQRPASPLRPSRSSGLADPDPRRIGGVG